MRGGTLGLGGENCWCVVLAVLHLAVESGSGLDSKEFQKNLPAKVVWAVPGKDAELPCDVTPALPGDNVTMVFWFKDNTGMPLYSLDARGGPLSTASHLTMTDDLGVRTYFITAGPPSKARLRIKNVTLNDQGVFRCRVDFVNSPTRNFQVNLTLVVQPSEPRIFDDVGHEIEVGASAGPFLQGLGLFLSCQVTGGRPRPTLTWWLNNTILDGVVDSSRASSTTVNQLSVASVPRHYKGAKLECRASSADMAGYIVREVPLVVYLKPDKVKIVTPNDLLSTRKTANFKCETSGSFPPAKLTWLLDGKPIRNAVVTEEVTDSFTGSILALTVDADDDGKELVCRADNPRLPGGSKNDSRKIHVAYPPKVSVLLESGVSPVKEGEDVVLRCQNSAQPAPYSYSWYQDNHLVPYNETGGLLPLDHILTLRKVGQKSGGQYACSAINTEGETYSAPLELVVQYAPRCKKGFEEVRVGGLPHETLVVQCHVDAVPPVNRFTWTYNTSRGVLPVQARAQNKGYTSVLEFPLGDGDAESLACWARNDIGQQKTPCQFFIVPAVPPEPPKSCLVRDAPHGGLEVSCLAGHDGGLHQNFVLEVTDVTAAQPEVPPGVTTLSDQGEGVGPSYRVLGEKPIFRLHSLEVGREYQVLVYAENARGRSEPQLLPNVRVKGSRTVSVPQSAAFPHLDSMSDGTDSAATSQGASSNDGAGLTVVIAGVAALGALLVIAVIIVTTTLMCRRRSPNVQRRQRPSSKPPSELELSEAGFGEGFHRRSAMYRASMYGECEERISRLIEGPDLILAPVSFSHQNSDY